MKNKFLLLILLLISCLVFVRCNKQNNEAKEFAFEYPANKVWAHGVNDTIVAQQKSVYFDGFELDLNYSSYQNQLFVGHELYDTIRNLTFDQWLSSIPYPQEHWYWVDMKNLNQDNADAIANIILMSAKKYGIRNKLMVEHTNEKALKVVKQNGLFVMLWVENIYWNQMTEEQWKEFTQQQIDYLQPDALSCEYRMYPLLPQTFPTHNIHFWHTPAKYTPENVAFTREMCQDTSIKIVLVDYDKPISY